MAFFITLTMLAVGIGAVGQVRFMGSAIGLAISTSVFNSYTRPRLRDMLGEDGISSIRHSTNVSVLNDDVRSTLAQGYNYQMTVLCAFAGAQVLAILLMWKKKQVKI